MFIKNISKGLPFEQATEEDVILLDQINEEKDINPHEDFFYYSQLDDTNFREQSEANGGTLLQQGDWVFSIDTMPNGYEDIHKGLYNFLVRTEDGVTEVLPIHPRVEGVAVTNTDPVIRVIDGRVFYVRASHNIYEETVFYAEMPVNVSVDKSVLEAFYDVVNHAFSSGGPFPYNVWNQRTPETGYHDFRMFPLDSLKGTVGLEDQVEATEPEDPETGDTGEV